MSRIREDNVWVPAVLHGCGQVGQVLAPAVFRQQMPADQIWETRAGLEAIVPEDGTSEIS